MNEGALISAEPASILTRYLSSESIDSIAQSFGVTQQALSKHLLKHDLEGWKEAQIARASARLEQAQQDLQDLRNGGYKREDEEIAPLDAVVLACARERVKSAQWTLEKLMRSVFGQDSAQVNVQANITIVHESV